MTELKKRVRMKPLARRTIILQAAIDVALKQGYAHVTRSSVSIAAHCAPGLINHYFNTIGYLRIEVLETAIQAEILPIIAEAIVLGDKNIGGLPSHLKRKVIQYISK